MCKNTYFIDVKKREVGIFLRRKDGSVLVTYIDIDDLDKVLEFNNTWVASYSKKTKSYYAQGAIKVNNGKRKTIMLHRYIKDPDSTKEVDHFNHDTLNNKRNNLRILTHQQNVWNFKKQPKGYYWSSQKNKYRACMRIEGKNKHLGYFNNEFEANKAYIDACKLYRNFD
jgi:hypothetical protein